MSKQFPRVRPVAPIASVPAEAVVNPEILALAERILARAQAGELQFLSAVALSQAGQLIDGYAFEAGASLLTAIGVLELQKAALIARNFEDLSMDDA